MILPNGFQLYRNWSSLPFSRVESAIIWNHAAIKIFGKEMLQPRLTAWMGTEAYTYSGRKHEPGAMPGVVETLRQKLQETTGTTFNSVLGNLYRDGKDSVSWHADNEPELGQEPVIASLSFGASRVFAVRHNESKERWNIVLNHGDLLVMHGRSQLDYQHSVPKTTKPLGKRINLTFRKVVGPSNV